MGEQEQQVKANCVPQNEEEKEKPNFLAVAETDFQMNRYVRNSHE
jgi:hypothetical protein